MNMKHLLYLLILLLVFSACENNSVVEEGFSGKEHITITCDMEQVSGKHFVSGDFYFESGVSQSSEQSRSGKYSVKVSEDAPYALGFAFKKVKKGNFITASIWRYSKEGRGKIRLAYQNNELNVVDYEVVNSEGDWEQIVISFSAEKDYDQINLYVFNPNEEPVFFDDLKVDYYNAKPINPLTDNALKIEISEKGMSKLFGYREQALELGVIGKDQKKYIKALVTYRGEQIPVKLRFKGDWTDHLEGDKWSFRIKVSGDHAINGLKSFSIQSPHTRSFLSEWFMHQLYEREGVLTTRYDFVPISLNGTNLGIFALEEHFDKQLIESRERREGPIVKFNESGFWEQMRYATEKQDWISTLFYEAAEVLPFKKKRTMKSPTLKQNFEVAQSLMLRYKEFDEHLEDIFDLKDLAKYYALADLGKMSHGLRWHNMRMYYNPVTTKLEQIAYDCFTQHLNNHYRIPILGMDTTKTFDKKEHYLTYQVFNNEEFRNHYISYLEKYSEPDYLEKVFTELNHSIDSLEKIIQVEYPNYVFSKEFFTKNADSIAYLLDDYKELNVSFNPLPSKYTSLADREVYFKEIGLKVYSSPTTDTNINQYSCYNLHTENVRLVGYELKIFPDSLFPIVGNVDGFDGAPGYYNFKADRFMRSIYFTVDNIKDSIFKTKISKWYFSQDQKGVTVEHKLEGSELKGANVLYDNEQRKITLQKGKYQFDQNVIVPSGWLLEINAGVDIVLNNGAVFLSHSPVMAMGTAINPISVRSTDGTGQGMVVINDHDETVLKYVNFDGLTALNQNKWSLTGAVTVYESNVSISNCSFSNNNCEDALNLIRSTFTMDSVVFNNTTADGFDADFCKGVISNSTFKASANDCIDLSGSLVDIINCSIIDSGDKGISGGEGSTLTVDNCQLKNVNIAVASKDQSRVFVSGLDLDEANCVYAAYQKKPEFGQAVIEVNSSQEENFKELMLIDLGSVIKYNGESHESTSKVNVDSLYAPFK